MKTTVFETPSAFMEVAQPLLEQNEAANNLMLGAGLRLIREPNAYGKAAPFLCLAETDRGPSLLAIMTPPHQLHLYAPEEIHAQAVRAVAQVLVDAAWAVPAVMAAEALAHEFAGVWQALTDRPYALHVRMRVHELRRVKHPTYSPGRFRVALDDDSGRIVEWLLAFNQEVNVAISIDEAEAQKTASAGIRDQELYVWEDGEVRSMAKRLRPTPHGECISSVYTPPACRGRGYATSCVARLSQAILDSGCTFSCLFSDLANPTSNKIYRSVGYEPVCDYVHLVLHEPEHLA